MENAVEIVNLGKMYRLFDKQSDRIQDIFWAGQASLLGPGAAVP